MNYIKLDGVVMFYPCLFCPSDNVWGSQRADAPRCAHFSTVITPSWITQRNALNFQKKKQKIWRKVPPYIDDNDEADNKMTMMTITVRKIG